MSFYLDNPLNKDLALQAWQKIQQANNITLLTHRFPDADGISACAALAEILVAEGKKIEVIYPTQPELHIPRQPENVLINQHVQQPDLIIICDTANRDRAYLPAEFNGVVTINLDHHISNSIKADYDFVDGMVSSACEVVYYFLQHGNYLKLPKKVADCLLFGMVYDTQVFQIPSTAPSTLRIAAALIESGAVLVDLIAELQLHRSPQIVTFWGKLLSMASYNENKTAVWVSVSCLLLEEHGLDFFAITGLSNFLASIAGVDIVAIFQELPANKFGGTKISLRSKKADVNALAQLFGGGGHRNAAGVTMALSLDEAVLLVTKYF